MAVTGYRRRRCGRGDWLSGVRRAEPVAWIRLQRRNCSRMIMAWGFGEDALSAYVMVTDQESVIDEFEASDMILDGN